MPNNKRTESDSLGVKKIDSKRMWGAQTQRSLENFKIGNNKMPNEIIIALGKQKKACVLANHSLGLINTKLTKAEMKALVIVLSAGYASGKENPDDVRDIFINDYDQSHSLALGVAYSRALKKLGLDTFWDENQDYIKLHKESA